MQRIENNWNQQMHVLNWAVSFTSFPEEKYIIKNISILLVTTQILIFSCIGNTAALTVQSKLYLFAELHLG